ncbi:ParB N-terminal domain-containing protein [Xylophilus sp. Leaf220]|uniref:ParB N-terminal domain-containing protein n=1 Tax=Xylophilus sp. Leaf220 TaxID=1735686 RepID=UPI0009E674EA|nr:ParB N-terminal domain-containing protein [Xylophilus sp. Leaf220]
MNFQENPDGVPLSKPTNAVDPVPQNRKTSASRKPQTRKKPAPKRKTSAARPAQKSRKTAVCIAAATATTAETGDSRETEDLPPLPPLAPFQGSVLQLSPDSIEPWEHSIDRTEFLDPDSYKQVYESIALAGTNTEPILVRKILQPPPSGPRYTAITGQLRLRACRDLGLDVQAQVEDAEGFDDHAALRHMFNSNRGRQSYAPAALGSWGERMLDTGVFPTARELCHTCGHDEGDFSKARKVAALPRELLDAYRGTSGPHFRHAVPLTDLLQKDKKGLMERAALVAQKNVDKNFSMKAREIYEALLPPKAEAPKNSGGATKKCPDCTARAQALLMASPFAAHMDVSMNTASLPPQGEGASVTAAPHKLDAERPTETQLQLDLGPEADLIAPAVAAARIDRDAVVASVEACEQEASEPVGPQFVLPTHLPSDAEPVITDAGVTRGGVFNDRTSKTCAVIWIPNVGEPYCKWLALRLSMLLSDIPDFDDVGTEAGGGLSA